ncbi:DUF932 domain-containing protein [Stackebrandtia nassauensis]|uniref:Phage/plasmid-related protein TIGR03299 n=1 Tax=Stackebrandtia nassauensis (strain DSM 44728 / CIP 108903 / NRRL B-16338 / NBRC 102104 / LLR-40K-21) TaxID=446470 RepID=D3PWP7_STANL|nr:DUF932 domain-containing protein [Stackebrandtia nassauensis]ADD43269.1 phage/plasmid-related protein TIGR03299 [Stackebrandtia nassauensis DSM 44728]
MDAAFDVNDAFAQAKLDQIRAADNQQAAIAAQVARGDLQPLGGDTYRVMTGWDRGEIIAYDTVQGIIAHHGLDTTTGQAALYSAAPPWHGLGCYIPGGTRDIDEVLKLSRLDFTVHTTPALYQWDDQLHTHPDKFHTLRSDTAAPLGVVGSKYHTVQNRECFEFLRNLVESYDVVWESAGAVRGGRRTFVSMRLPDTVTVDAAGINDTITPFVVVFNSHDGSSSITAVVTPYRPVCANTERLALDNAYTSWSIRHTESAMHQMRQARRTLKMSVKYYDEFAAQQTTLAHHDMVIDEFRALIDELWPLEPNATKRGKTNAKNRREALMAQWDTESRRCGSTLYAAERAITGYIDHDKPRMLGKFSTLNAARATAIVEGRDDGLKTKAHKKLMLRVR